VVSRPAGEAASASKPGMVVAGSSTGWRTGVRFPPAPLRPKSLSTRAFGGRHEGGRILVHYVTPADQRFCGRHAKGAGQPRTTCSPPADTCEGRREGRRRPARPPSRSARRPTQRVTADEDRPGDGELAYWVSPGSTDHTGQRWRALAAVRCAFALRSSLSGSDGAPAHTAPAPSF
jgi:hypothetical protein